jgi:predicted O-methyltransferase YrrM
MRIATEILSAFLPGWFRQYLRAYHRKFIFRRSMRRFCRDPESFMGKNSKNISNLIYGWGNESWSAQEEYIEACLKCAAHSSGPILECGSGLTTILLGVVAQKSGNSVWSLEHSQDWKERVSTYLRTYRIKSVHLCLSELQGYGEFSWYTPPLDEMPKSFAMVVCDGPPGDTHGGRYGLLPVMKSRLAPSAVILLDDARRDGELASATRWANELKSSFVTLGTRKPFIKIVVPDTEKIASLTSPGKKLTSRTY